MGKSYKSHAFFDGIKYSCQNALKQNKIKLIVTLCFVLASICTGIFVAIKANNSYNLSKLQEIDLCDYYSGAVATASAFMSRSFSLLINITLLICLSFSPFCFVLAEVLFVYRAYLFGLNITLIFIFYGIGSMVTAIIVVLPCQLLTLLFLIVFYILLLNINCNRKKFGRCETNRGLVILFGILILILINLVETILLFVLNGKVILII